MNDRDPDVNKIHNRIVNVVIAIGVIGLLLLGIAAIAQRNEEPECIAPVYDPRDGTRYCSNY